MSGWFYLGFGNDDEFGMTALLERGRHSHHGIADVQVFGCDAGSDRHDLSGEIPSERQRELDGPKQRLLSSLPDPAQHHLTVALCVCEKIALYKIIIFPKQKKNKYLYQCTLYILNTYQNNNQDTYSKVKISKVSVLNIYQNNNCLTTYPEDNAWTSLVSGGSVGLKKSISIFKSSFTNYSIVRDGDLVPVEKSHSSPEDTMDTKLSMF